MIHLTIHRHFPHLSALIVALATLSQPQQIFAQTAATKEATALSIRSLDKAIDEVVDKLSLEQKVGQMTQIDLGVIAVGSPCGLQQPQTLDKAKLREELGFKGLAVTDWEDIYQLHTTHKVAASLREAVKLAINAGIDMSMTPNDFQFNQHLIDLVKSGEVPMARINEAVHRILYVKHQLGLFNAFNPLVYPVFQQNPTQIGNNTHRSVALTAAEESITLLKNATSANGNPTLPLDASRQLFLFGSAANDLNLLNGAWTNTWQGNDSQYRHNPSFPTIYEALSGSSSIVDEDKSNVAAPRPKSCTWLPAKSRTAKQLKTLKKNTLPQRCGRFLCGRNPRNRDSGQHR